MPRRLGSKELVSPLMDEGPPVTGKTDGEEDRSNKIYCVGAGKGSSLP